MPMRTLVAADDRGGLRLPRSRNRKLSGTDRCRIATPHLGLQQYQVNVQALKSKSYRF